MLSSPVYRSVESDDRQEFSMLVIICSAPGALFVLRRPNATTVFLHSKLCVQNR